MFLTYYHNLALKDVNLDVSDPGKFFIVRWLYARGRDRRTYVGVQAAMMKTFLYILNENKVQSSTVINCTIREIFQPIESNPHRGYMNGYIAGIKRGVDLPVACETVLEQCRSVVVLADIVKMAPPYISHHSGWTVSTSGRCLSWWCFSSTSWHDPWSINSGQTAYKTKYRTM